MGSNVDFGQIALTGAAQQLTGIPGSTESISIKNLSAVNNMWLGKDNTVSTTTGDRLDPGERLSMDALNARRIWIIGTAADRISWAVLKP